MTKPDKKELNREVAQHILFKYSSVVYEVKEGKRDSTRMQLFSILAPLQSMKVEGRLG